MKKAAFIIAILILASSSFAFIRQPFAEMGITAGGTYSDSCMRYVLANYPAIEDSAVLIVFLNNENYLSSSAREYQLFAYRLFHPTDTIVSTPWGDFLRLNEVFPAQEIIDSLHAAIGRDSSDFDIIVRNITRDTMYVSVVNIDPANSGNLFRIYAFIIENHLHPPSGTASEYNWVVRGVFPYYLGDMFSAPAVGDTLDMSLDFTRSYFWNTSNCEVVFIIDDPISNEVLQSVKTVLPLPAYMYFVTSLSPTYNILNLGDTAIITNVIKNLGANGDSIYIDFTIDAPIPWDVAIYYNGTVISGDTTIFLDTAAIDSLKIVVISDPTVKATAEINVNYSALNAPDSFEFRYIATTGGDILLVDDDYRYDYEHYYTEVLDSLGLQYFYYNRRNGPLDGQIIEKFNIVIWFTGNYSRNRTLQSSDRSALKYYLDRGGKLFISGTEIGYDLVLDGRYTDYEFFESYLRASSDRSALFDSASSHDVHGVPGDPISDGLQFSIDDGDGADNSRYADVITPIAGAKPIFYYGPGMRECAGLRYGSGWHEHYGLVYLGFGFEAIDSFNHRLTVMQRIINWLRDSASVAEINPRPKTVYINASPNPFNSMCKISFYAPQKAVIEITDITGRIVLRKNVEGRGTMIWGAKDNSSGIYLVRISDEKSIMRKKIILVK